MEEISVTVFISQPMRNRNKEDILAERKHIMDKLPYLIDCNNCLEIPMLSDLTNSINSPAHCLGISIQDMSHSDLVVFAPGWRDARGCVVEHAVCLMYKIPYIEVLKDENSQYYISKDGRGNSKCSKPN